MKFEKTAILMSEIFKYTNCIRVSDKLSCKPILASTSFTFLFSTFKLVCFMWKLRVRSMFLADLIAVVDKLKDDGVNNLKYLYIQKY